MHDHEKQFAIEAIRAYLQLRPHSADTLEGIHQFWIRWPGFPPSPQVTLAALEFMQQVGELQSRHIHQRVIWRSASSAT